MQYLVGNKRYELSGHTNNVLAVITDKKIPIEDGQNAGEVDYFEPELIASTDYSPFGVRLSERNWNSSAYRSSFQGQEHDDEVKGEGRSVNYTYRMHSPDLGRFFAVDPLSPEYPWNSPYAFSENRVIDNIELEGLEELDFTKFSEAMEKGATLLQNRVGQAFGDILDTQGEIGFRNENYLSPHFTTDGKSYTIKEGVDPFTGINGIFKDAKKYKIDCAIFAQLIKLKGMADAMGEDKFNAFISTQSTPFTIRSHGSTGIVHKEIWVRKDNKMLSGTKKLENENKILAEMPIGSEVTITSSFLQGTIWHNENIVKVGKDKYVGLGVEGSMKKIKKRMVEIGKSLSTPKPGVDAKIDPSSKIRVSNVKINQIRVTGAT